MSARPCGSVDVLARHEGRRLLHEPVRLQSAGALTRRPRAARALPGLSAGWRLAQQSREPGLPVIDITHDIFPVHRIADRVAITENGEKGADV